MDTVAGPWSRKDWFTNFRCPRCQVTTRHVPLRSGWNTASVLCPSCRSAYQVLGNVRFGAVMGLFIGFVAGTTGLAISFLTDTLIEPWALMMVGFVVALSVLPVV